MANIGIVIATDENVATVEKYKASVCDSCAKKNKIGACDACSDRDETSAERCIAYNSIGAQVGDKVEYSKNRGAGIVFALVVFALPLVCALISYLIAMMLTDDPGTGGRTAVACFAFAMIAVGFYAYKVSKRRCEHTITTILDD